MTFECFCYLPSHVFPSPENPSIHVHSKLPWMLLKIGIKINFDFLEKLSCLKKEKLTSSCDQNNFFYLMGLYKLN